MERNSWQGFCGYCGAPVQPFQGVIDTSGRWPGYQIVCVEHALPDAFDAPTPPEASPVLSGNSVGLSLRVVR